MKMFLKRLDVVGFKSFAERVSIDFVPGVTAVVGPNGSGKSNITDSIRWVLGEQSAKSLRGAKMEDIIFSGSDSRKALNMAEVTLTLDNDDHFLPLDYHEVSVTRRVYRSGDSEFFINKQACRLKDIVDLFLDSGLGREAFSIISQGKVEEILSSKAEERRTIFEEAAGVLKYKSRKKKAEYKLAETQENLNRVTDILNELENQIEPLKMQASIAKDYLDKKNELEKSEVALIVYEIEELYQKWEQLKKELQKHQDLEIEMSTNLQKQELQIEEWKQKIQHLDESINELQQVLLVTSEELEKLEGKKEVLKERKKNATKNKSQLEDNQIELEKQLSGLKEKEDQARQILSDYMQEVSSDEQKLVEKQKQFAEIDGDIDEKIERIKSEYIELLNQQAASKNELSYLTEQLNQQKLKQSRLEHDNAKFLQDRLVILDKKLELEKKLAEIQETIQGQIKTFREEQIKLEQAKGKYQKSETMLYKSYQFLQQTKSRKEMLEEMQEDYAGYFQGVKEILKAKNDKLQGIEGAIAELIQVPKEYELAIEIALGGATQHIVVENEENARAAIQYLKKQSFGRATFLPLTVMKERNIADYQIKLIGEHPSYIGIAADLIDYLPKFDAVIKNVLGTVIVTKDLKGANELAKILQFKYRLVTLDGDVVNPGGSMTGGAVKQKSNSLLSRARELETITIKLGEMEEKTAQAEKQVKILKQEIQEMEMNISVLRENGEKLRYNEQLVLSEIRQIELEEKNLNERLSIYDQEMELYREDQLKMTARITELNKIIPEINAQITQFDEDIKRMSEQKNDQKNTLELLQTEITDLKVVLASKKQLLSNQQEKLTQINLDYEEKFNQLQEIVADLALLNEEMNSNHFGEAELDEASKEKLQNKQDIIKLISRQREQRLEIQTKLEDKEREDKELRRQHKQLNDALKDEEVKINRLDVDLENRLSHLSEEYFLTFEAAKEKYPLLHEVNEVRKQVKLIKLAIEELGTVNLGAIDEFERISGRFNFLNEQKADLLEAKNTLYKVIDEMDEEMKKRFISTFNSVNEHFETVFKSLFGGGRADLQLTDPNDLLHTGVEIVAQPPGKKLQNLGLLSGGERALTAIALLFSILQVRPVPFCVLDEVEAALDEANVNRFAQFLKKFSDHTQFIVITHRKGTMEEADVLYGVTMQELGVSKLVSVRLEESKELVANKI